MVEELQLVPTGRDNAALELKGISEATHAYAVLGIGRAASRFEATVRERTAPLVGRALELALLLERWQLVQAVHAGIAALARPYREVLILRDLEGLSGDETCAALGLDLSAMKTRLHRARTQLRAALERPPTFAKRA